MVEVLCQRAPGAIRFPGEYSLQIGFRRGCHYVREWQRPVTRVGSWDEVTGCSDMEEPRTKV